MRRGILTVLANWKGSSNRKPLILRGARQVGKSYVVREFAKSFEYFVELNFEEQPNLKRVFEGSLSPEEVIKRISAFIDVPIVDGETLVFIDEIQLCPQAITALRYFFEKRPALHVISAGSLLEFELEKIGLPVGRVESLFLYPLSFREFLEALEKTHLIAEIESSITKLPDVIHEELLKLVILYCHLGGMPEVIADYLKQQNFQNTARIQNSLLNSFRQDFLKYSTKYQIDAVSEVFDAIPRQLTKKFVYNAVNQNIKSTKLSAALELLNKAGVCKKIFHTQANGIPLGSEIKPNLFKVTFLDIGLALRLLGINLYAHSLESQQQNFAPEEISLNYVNKGAIAEQFVAQELCSYQDCFSPANLYYWVREQPSSMAELDYLIAKNDQILPIEVKSGTAGNLKSMHLFLKEKPQIKAGYRISSRRYEVFRTITSIPLYGIWTLIQA